MVVTICFLADPVRAFEECRRAFKEEGRLIVGLVPADSAVGKNFTLEKDAKDTISIPSPDFTRVIRSSALLIQQDLPLTVRAVAFSLPPENRSQYVKKSSRTRGSWRSN